MNYTINKDGQEIQIRLTDEQIEELRVRDAFTKEGLYIGGGNISGKRSFYSSFYQISWETREQDSVYIGVYMNSTLAESLGNLRIRCKENGHIA